MNSVNAVFAVSSAESAGDGLIVGEIFPSPLVNSSDGYIVHCSLTSSTYSLWNDTREGLESHINNPCRCFYISASHWCGWLRVDDRPRWCRNLYGFEASCVCWNRRIRHASYHIVDC